MTFGAPLWLLLLASIALLPRVARRSVEEPAGARRRAATLVRALLLALLVLALAEPQVRGRSERLDVVFAVDASESMGEEGGRAARAFLGGAAGAMGRADRASVVVFGAEALVEAAGSPSLPLPPYASRPGAGASDPATALRLATALFEPGAGRRVVLLTDGEENRGSLLEAAAAAAGSGVDLLLVPLEPRRTDDVRVEALVAPASAVEGEPFELRLAVRSPRAARARVRYYAGRDLLASDEVALEPGPANLLVLQAQPLEPGVRTYRAEVEAAGDPVPQNNSAEATVEVKGAATVLLAGPRPERLESLARILASERIAAERSGLDGIPRGLAGLRRYRAVLLHDVAAEDLGEAGMALLAAYVRDAGGTLLMVGGELSFGPGGYLGTPVEEVLPVAMEVKERRYYPTVALIAAIDKSGSMAGVGPAQKIEVAKVGAAAAIELLDERDEAGVIGFDSAAQWVSPLRSVRERAAILHDLATLRAGGGTDIYPAMDEAYQALRASSRRVKHLILLSDGQSPPRDYSGLAARMARDGITVSTVAVGADADTHTMRVIAEAGKGRTYAASDPALLPRIFTKEALTIQRSYVVEESFRPRLVSGHEVLSGLDLASAPALHGYVATWPRGEAELLLASHRDDPVLALWRTGLGKAVAFTPDLGARWSRDWAAWPGWGRLWSQLFRWSATGAAPGGIHVRSAWAAGKLHVSADLVGEEGDYVNFARLETAASAPGGRRRTAALRQTGPGRYEGTIDAPEPGAHLVTVTERARPPGRSDASASDLAASDIAASGLATVDVPYSPEFRPSGDGRANLERVAAAVGARIATDPAAVFRHDLPIPGQRRPLRPLLLWILPFVLLADVAVRRVALPEGWLSRLAGRVAARLPRLRPAAPAEAPAPLRRLRSIKEALGRGESSEALPASPSVPPPDATLAAAPPPPTPGTDEAVAPEPSAAAGSTTGRLLAAKRRLK